MLVFGWNFSWCLVEILKLKCDVICVWTCDMISTLRSVVPLAMFCINGRVKSFGFSVSCFIIIINQKSQLSDDHLTLWLINWLRSKLQSSGRRSHSSIRMAMVGILKPKTITLERYWFTSISYKFLQQKYHVNCTCTLYSFNSNCFWGLCSTGHKTFIKHQKRYNGSHC